MTEADIERARDLLYARDVIKEFLSCRDINAPFVQEYLKSSYEYQRAEGRKLPRAKVCHINITDDKALDDIDGDTLTYWAIPRTILERAMRFELDRINADLAFIGVEQDATEITEKANG